MAVLLGAPYKEGEMEEYYTFTDAADLFRWALVGLEMQTIKSTQTPVCEQKVRLAWGRDSVSLVPRQNLNAIVPKDLKPTNIIVETDTPEEVDAPLYPDKPVGTASVYYVEEGKEKQLISTVDLVPSEQIDKSGILEVLNVIGTIFKSYWFLVLIGIIVLLFIIYIIAAKVHRARVKKNRKVKRYRNF